MMKELYKSIITQAHSGIRNIVYTFIIFQTPQNSGGRAWWGPGEGIRQSWQRHGAGAAEERLRAEPVCAGAVRHPGGLLLRPGPGQRQRHRGARGGAGGPGRHGDRERRGEGRGARQHVPDDEPDPVPDQDDGGEGETGGEEFFKPKMWVSLLMSKLWMLPSVAIGLEMKIWFKPHPWPLCERRKFLGLPMFIKSHKHKIMSRAAQSCGQF